MSYQAEISRENPSSFVFLVDQSGSMRNPFGGASAKSKSEAVADAINRFLQNLSIMCSKADGVRDFYHIGVIGYSNAADSLLDVNDDPQRLVPISELASNPLRVEERLKRIDDGAGGFIEQSVKFPIWFEPVAYGRTFMGHAIEMCSTFLSDFIGAHPDCYPPIVINITDGAYDPESNPVEPAKSLREIASSDGNVLFFNVHISHLGGHPIEFPDSRGELADDYAQLLFDMSSKLPPSMLELAISEEYVVSDESRGFVFNGDLISVIRFIDIGTRHTRQVKRLGYSP